MCMESRVNKYSSNNVPSRTARNARLYKEIYGKYDDLNNLPLEDNTDEIDMARLQEILSANKTKKDDVRTDNYINTVEKKKRNIDEQRVYDINKILEKAKYENSKLKETASIPKIDTSILSTLENREILVDDVKLMEKEKFEAKENHHQKEDLSMTRELKFKGLSETVENPLLKNVMPNNDLSLDLFENLKPTENTITTKPIREATKISTSNDTKDQIKNIGEVDVHSGDTRDIDIIKNDKNEANDFFTSSYEFSTNDFLDAPSKSGNVVKIILLFLAIIIFSGVIAYFVIHYGIGA